MRLPYLVAAAVCDILLLSAPQLVGASSALWIQPSNTWYGIDGTWSNFAFGVGSPSQMVYLTVATALSEIWVVENGGCVPVQICINARGGVFEIQASSSWRSLGGWQLGMNYTGMEGNGDYGLETIAFTNTITQTTTALDGTLIAAINDTDYYQGFVGVGVTRGKFGSNLTNPFISQLAETYGDIPSHSYGYTAGAYYRDVGETNGTVASLVLGGYDTNRFVPHDTTFSLDPVTRLPTVLLRGVTAQVSYRDKAPTHWNSSTQALVTMNDSVRALVDSSTPYLWLPTAVCDRFADALNLTWREDLGVYIFSDGAQYNNYQEDTSLSFTFTVSSYDNADNFGEPLDVPGVVNITIPTAAFAQLLRYPFKNVIQWGDSSIPYFPLKRSTKDINNNQYIIGRVFMQEAYIITNYDKGTFSLHQALFPQNAVSNYSLQDIDRPPDSPYPAYVGKSPGVGLSTGQTVGIVLSAFAIGSVLGVLLWWCCRRRRRNAKKKKQQPAEQAEEDKEESDSVDDDQPRSPVRRMFSAMIRRKKSKKPAAVHEVEGNTAQPVEVGADAQHQVFELPVPPEPVELDSHDVGEEDVTDFGVDSEEGLSEYEIAQRKLNRQLQGPVPTYSPPTAPMPPPENHDKMMQDISPVAHHRPHDDPSPASSPTYANSNSLPDTLPSPMTPHPDWTGRHFDLPSPMTVAPPVRFHAPHSPTSPSGPGSSYSPVSPDSPHYPPSYAPSSLSRSDSNNVSPTSVGSMRLPSPTYHRTQRTPIDPSRVICLGPLPENVQVLHQQPSLPRIITPDGRIIEPGPSSPRHTQDSLLPTTGSSRRRSSHGRRGSNETLGSDYTVEEESRLKEEEITRHLSRRDQNHDHGAHDDDFPRSPRSMERIEAGDELVHVPQVAEKRYSWEQDDRS
ncbi:aspartic peptidase domain-containing protein [Diplogelasinospora grovesii]|uniref:Aspartic peptidase domain-containing protein n=1 Tax=Diplogelasinospora grovesii TaxID=303347 RepID=A0AAN6NFB8_9PEZI|nr:aspartic peptidase domain-containing protein [Diplogelasinospora grovesii]